MLGIGVCLFIIDTGLLVVWLFFGIAICVNNHRDAETGARYLQIHLTTVLHFTATITICIVLEAYRAFEYIAYQVHDRVVVHMFHVQGEPQLRPPQERRSILGYLISWVVSLLVAFGTDYCSLDDMCVHTEADNRLWVGEFVIAVWCMVDSGLAIIWSIGMAITHFCFHTTTAKIKTDAP
jgi:hypothetical protein